MKLTQAKDTTSVYLITLENESGLTLTYNGSEALSAKLWPGDDRPTVATPTVVWVTAPNQIQITISASDLTNVLPGVYRIRVYVGGTTHAAEAEIEVLAAPGSATALATYCAVEDVRKRYPLVEQLQTPNDRAGFEEQRALAREWLDESIISKYDAIQKSKNILDGRQEMTTWLSQNRLIVTPLVVSTTAYQTIGYILQGAAFGNRDPKADLARMADWAFDQAKILATRPFEIDVSDSINGSIRVTVGVGGVQGVLA